MFCQIYCSFVVELLRYDNIAMLVIDIGSSHYSIKGTKAFAIKNYGRFWNSSCNKAVSHTFNLIDAVETVLITADQDALYLTCLIQ